MSITLPSFPNPVDEVSARLVAGGNRPKGFAKGYFVEPTVFADVDNRSRLAQEEIFGPVLAVMPFDTEEEAIRLIHLPPIGDELRPLGLGAVDVLDQLLLALAPNHRTEGRLRIRPGTHLQLGRAAVGC